MNIPFIYGASYFGASLLFIIFLIYRLVQYAERIKNCEYEVYVNTAGIGQNPPKFVELMEGKTINFQLDEHKISVPQVSLNKGLVYVERISYLYSLLKECIDRPCEDKTSEIKNNILKIKVYNQIVKSIYDLSKPFVWNKRKYKKKLFTKARNDFKFTLNITSEIIDYWTTVGKLVALQSKGSTFRKTLGENATLNSIDWDSNGKISIKPRFASYMK